MKKGIRHQNNAQSKTSPRPKVCNEMQNAHVKNSFPVNYV